jgi:hypothetical protein
VETQNKLCCISKSMGFLRQIYFFFNVFLRQVCVRCACVQTFLGGAMCDRTFAHFLQQNGQNLPFAILQLFTHILKHTRSSKTVKDVLKPSFSHLCVRTNIWTCKVRVCDPKNGLNPPFGFHGQKNIFFTL